MRHALKLSEEIGEFIEYWGFKKVHGKVWTLIFLSKKPIDANFLISNLKVSKSLVSMTLKDLQHYNVILEVPKDGPTVCYKPNLKVKDVIFDVLANRESKMLEKIKTACESLNNTAEASGEGTLSQKRMDQMTEMVESTNFYLNTLLSLKDNNSLPLFNKMDYTE